MHIRESKFSNKDSLISFISTINKTFRCTVRKCIQFCAFDLIDQKRNHLNICRAKRRSQKQKPDREHDV